MPTLSATAARSQTLAAYNCLRIPSVTRKSRLKGGFFYVRGVIYSKTAIDSTCAVCGNIFMTPAPNRR